MAPKLSAAESAAAFVVEKDMDEKIRSITATELAQMKFHPVAESFPRMPDEDYQALKASIKQNGLDEPILVWNGMIADGRHRAKAIIELGIPATIKDVSHLSEADMVRLVLRTNTNRRHMTTGQRALLAHDLARGLVSINLESISIGAAAKLFGVSAPTVNMLVRALKDAPELRQAIADGKITVNGAKSLAEFIQSLPGPERKAAVDDVNNGDAAAVQAQAQAASLVHTTSTQPNPPRAHASNGIHGAYAAWFQEIDELPRLLCDHPPNPDLCRRLREAIESASTAISEAERQGENSGND